MWGLGHRGAAQQEAQYAAQRADDEGRGERLLLDLLGGVAAGIGGLMIDLPADIAWPGR